MSKLINISDKLYMKLKAIKGERSFTKVIEDLVEEKRKKKFLEFFGKGGIDEKKMKEIKEGWKKWSEKYS